MKKRLFPCDSICQLIERFTSQQTPADQLLTNVSDLPGENTLCANSSYLVFPEVWTLEKPLTYTLGWKGKDTDDDLWKYLSRKKDSRSQTVLKRCCCYQKHFIVVSSVAMLLVLQACSFQRVIKWNWHSWLLGLELSLWDGSDHILSFFLT